MRKKYDKESKRETVIMIQEHGKPVVVQVARELELSDNTLYHWMSEFKQDSGSDFRGSGNLKVEKNQADLQKKRIGLNHLQPTSNMYNAILINNGVGCLTKWN